MKKQLILAAILVLTLSVFTGCGCTNSKNPVGMNPTEMTAATTEAATTVPTTTPTDAAILPTEAAPSATDGMTSDSTGASGEADSTENSGAMDNTDGTGTTDTTEKSRARSRAIR